MLPMPYNQDILDALEKLQKVSPSQLQQPEELYRGTTTKAALTCPPAAIADENSACGKPFDPYRLEAERGKWCEHEVAARPMFKAIENVGRKLTGRDELFQELMIDLGHNFVDKRDDRARDPYELFCDSVFEHSQAEVGRSNLKGASRGCYKICKPKAGYNGNGGNWRGLKDVLRISVEFKSLHMLYMGVRALLGRVGVFQSGFGAKTMPVGAYAFGPIFRMKDRFAELTPDPDQSNAPVATNTLKAPEVFYKDFQIILGCSGEACRPGPYLLELQLHVESMAQAKHHGGHKLYQKLRVLRPNQVDALRELVNQSNAEAIYGGPASELSTTVSVARNAGLVHDEFHERYAARFRGVVEALMASSKE